MLIGRESAPPFRLWLLVAGSRMRLLHGHGYAVGAIWQYTQGMGQHEILFYSNALIFPVAGSRIQLRGPRAAPSVHIGNGRLTPSDRRQQMRNGHRAT